MDEVLHTTDGLYSQVAELIQSARKQVATQVNSALLATYWNVGRLIVEDEQKSAHRAEYGKQVLQTLSKRLTKEFGKGFSRPNLHWMRELYIKYPKCQTLSNKLSWSHYCELLSISDDDKRSFYEHECINARWSFRELKRQIDSSLFERLLLSDGQGNTAQQGATDSRGGANDKVFGRERMNGIDREGD